MFVSLSGPKHSKCSGSPWRVRTEPQTRGTEWQALSPAGSNAGYDSLTLVPHPIAGPYLEVTAPAALKDQVPKHGCQFGEKARLVGAKKAVR